jgi:hypothetical protein
MPPFGSDLVPASRPERQSRVSAFRNVIRKSALLNLVIVLTSLPVLLWSGGPNTVGVSLAIMVGISLIIWAFTFAVFTFVSLPRVFRLPEQSGKPRPSARSGQPNAVRDRWLDGPG